MGQRLRDVWRFLPRRARRILAAAAGASVLLVGLVMLVTPGPAIVVIPLGLSILAAEFAWARRWIRTLLPDAWQPEFVREPQERGGTGPTSEPSPDRGERDEP